MHPMLIGSLLLRRIWDFGLMIRNYLCGGLLFGLSYNLFFIYFLVAGLLSFLFLFDSGIRAHNTRLVVAHFHLFLAGFVAFTSLYFIRFTLCDFSSNAGYAWRFKFSCLYALIPVLAITVFTNFTNFSFTGSTRRSIFEIPFTTSLISGVVTRVCFIVAVSLFLIFYFIPALTIKSGNLSFSGFLHTKTTKPSSRKSLRKGRSAWWRTAGGMAAGFKRRPSRGRTGGMGVRRSRFHKRIATFRLLIAALRGFTLHRGAAVGVSSRKSLRKGRSAWWRTAGGMAAGFKRRPSRGGLLY